VPALLLVVLVFAYPVGAILARTFTDHVGTQGGPFANLGWFFSDPVQVKILLRTFQTSLIVTVVCLLVCYPFAYALTKVRGRWQTLLLGITVISCWQSILVRNYGWRTILRDNGPLNDALGLVGLGPLHLLGTTTGVIVGMCQIMAPFMILPLYASLRTIDTRLVVAARSLGASPTAAFFKVYAPLSAPGVVAGCLLVAVVSLGFFITPALLGSSTNALLSQAIQLQISRTLDWGHAGAQSLVLLVSTLLLLAASYLLGQRRLAVLSGRGSST
jgi:putative spermidine/putrescine transport system permease protein